VLTADAARELATAIDALTHDPRSRGGSAKIAAPQDLELHVR
jgi:hypothetical protein